MTPPIDHDSPNNVIPINRAMVDTLKRLIAAVGDRVWVGPSHFNAIMVDRKGFVQSFKVPNPPPPLWVVSVMPSIFQSTRSYMFTDLSAETVRCECAEFTFYRQVGDVLEYREL
jgi:hypothetical protein